MLRIESSDNKKLKRLISLKQKKVRFKENLFLIEGFKIVDEAVSGNSVIDMILVSDSFYEKNSEFCSSLDNSGISIYITSDSNLQKCSSLKTPQGIIAVLIKPDTSFESIADGGKQLVILDSISDPGNLGTVIRTADAFGFGGVLLMPGSADVYSSKTVQAAMGSVLRVGCAEIQPTDLDILKSIGYTIYGMEMSGSDMSSESFNGLKTAVVIGSESHGLNDVTKIKCDKLLKIKMSGGAESLNAAVAAGIVLHKAADSILCD